MEKRLTNLTMSAVLCIGFFASQCNNSGNPTGPVTNNPALMAKWNISSLLQTYGNTTDTIWPYTQARLHGDMFSGTCVLTFTKDLTFNMMIAGTLYSSGDSMPVADSSLAGTWTSSGNTLSMKKTDDPVADAATYSISGTTLTIKGTDKGSNGEPDTITTIVATN
jgi:hypothetical protein